MDRDPPCSFEEIVNRADFVRQHVDKHIKRPAGRPSTQKGAPITVSFGDMPQGKATRSGYLRRGESPKLLRELRRTHPDDELDLHGCTLAQARPRLKDFLDQACIRGMETLLIIHGRGRHSQNQQSVLRPMVKQWLASCDQVRCYAAAPPGLGGTGSLLVRL